MLALLSALLIATTVADVRRSETASIERAAAAEAARLSARIEGGASPMTALAGETFAHGGYAFVETEAGRIVAGERPGAPAPSMSGAGLQATQGASASLLRAEGGYAHAAKSFQSPDGARLTLRVGLPLAPAAAAAADAMVRGLIATLGFLAVALPALALIVDRTASPLRALTRAVSRPGAAREEMRAAGARRDEVGALARAHLSIARDLAENADALHRLTYDDPLTTLPNRASLTSRLAAALQLGQPCALLDIELDGVTRVAAGLGQQVGDETIRAAAARLLTTFEGWSRDAALGDDQPILLARISDSGFGLLVRGADAEAATSLAETALAAFETPLVVGEHRLMATLTIGAALAPDDGDEAGALLCSAAAALSAARAAGSQSLRFAGQELTRMAYGRLKLEQDLRRAVETGELELHYQPQIALRSDTVFGAEALVRWRHPIRGMVSPMEFVPIAEECGLMEPLGRFVLAEACRRAADWHGRGVEVRIAVNVSPIQFRKPGFADRTLDIIHASGADPSLIELEITESAAMGDPEHAARELAPLKAAGIRVAIDDFGTGYSNLAALTRLPFDVLKIDRGFVRDASSEAGARVVVGTVIGMAENLGFETIAEGVETKEQLDFVTSHGCTYAQGYLFGRPMAPAAFEAWYAERMVEELRAMSVREARAAMRAAG